MKEFLEEKFPNIRIVGYRSPPFRLLTSEEDAAVCDEINRLKPDIICVGLGTPKQDYWIEDHLYKIRGSVFIAKRGRHPREGNEFRKGERRIRESTY